MSKTKVYIEKNFRISNVDDKLFSSFIEHLGRAVYTGIYEPGHSTADEQGFRKDVVDLVKELGVTMVRYPGGNFLSGYDWTDGIGPKKDRPTRLDLAWKTIERNEIGIDEFVDWCKKANTQPMAAVNMGTGSPRDAGNMVEYCNFKGGTYWSDLRIKNGHKEPHGIKTWCIGNEMDGPWQICRMEAPEYGKKARETAKIMKWVDDSIELVLCGSSSSLMPSYPEWDRIVLEQAYDNVEYISMHRYYENLGSDKDFLASFLDMDNFIQAVKSTADYVKALKRSKKTMFISFDEWNIWYQKKHKNLDWQEQPEILEDKYSLLDALVFGGLGITLLNNADRVKIACLAQLVNVIAPIFTQKGGKAIKQSTYYPFRDISLYGRGTVLKPVVIGEKVETCYGDAQKLNVSVVHDEQKGELNLFCLNIDKEDAVLNLDLRSFGNVSMIEHICLDGPDLNMINSFDKEDAVSPRNLKTLKECGDNFDLSIPQRSWNVLRFSVK